MSDAKIKVVGVTVAVLLHLLVAIALVQDSIIKILFPKPKIEKVVEKKPKPVMSIRLLATPKQQLLPELPEPPKVTEKKRFNRTTSEQPQEKPKNAKFFGEHDTVAQSDTAADPNAKEMPAIKGEKERNFPNSASNYQDGSLESDALAHIAQPQKPTPPKPPAPPKEVVENQTEPQNEQSQQMDAGKPLSGSSVPLADYLDAINKLPSEIRSKDPVAELPDSDKGKADHESEKEELPKELVKREKPREKVAKKPLPRIDRVGQPGFRPTTEANKAMGSISRRGGVSSHDTDATPLGKYKAAVLDSIAKEWYRRIGRNPDLIKPGTVFVCWYVTDEGKVKVYNQETRLGSEIQTGMTFQAITGAKIPKMTPSLKAELKGDPVDFKMTFQFN